MRPKKPKKHVKDVVTLRLPKWTIIKLRKLSGALHRKPSALMRKWIIEGLQYEIAQYNSRQHEMNKQILDRIKEKLLAKE